MTTADDFKSFSKIDRFKGVTMLITQKLHGTNGQIYIYQTENGLELKVGSRTRWITPEDDNYGFAKFVYENKEEIIQKLGIGRHFGEWCGKGINSGEGLTEKEFFLFNPPFIQDFPKRIRTVPLMYAGQFDEKIIDLYMNILKEKGSCLVPGYMSTEGIVITIEGKRYKKVFNAEETQWTGKKKEKKVFPDMPDVSHLLHPLRLEKLLSRDERYLKNYPKSLSDICKDYINDLAEEGHLSSDEDEMKLIKKSLGRSLFEFVKIHVDTIIKKLSNGV